MCHKAVQIQKIKNLGYIIRKCEFSNVALFISNILLDFSPKGLKLCLFNGQERLSYLYG